MPESKCNPYVYVIQEVSSGRFYIGCRTAKGCHSGELGLTYFTSSKYIKNVWKVDKFSFVIVEIHPCLNPNDAYNLEERMQRQVCAHRNVMYLNKNINGELFNVRGSKHNVGFKHSDESKLKMSEFHRGKTLSAETRDKLSKIRKGRKFSDSHKEAISRGQLGNKKGANLYLFLSPDGIQYEVLGIKKFLKENDLPNLCTVSRFVNMGVISIEKTKRGKLYNLNGWTIDCLGLYCRL